MSVASGLNALAHCVDSMWAPDADPIDRALACEGIRALRAGLPKVAADPADLEGREEHCTRPTCPRSPSLPPDPACTTRSATFSAVHTTSRTRRRTQWCCHMCWHSTPQQHLARSGGSPKRWGLGWPSTGCRTCGGSCRHPCASRLWLRRVRHPSGGRGHHVGRIAGQPAARHHRRPPPPAARGVGGNRSAGTCGPGEEAAIIAMVTDPGHAQAGKSPRPATRALHSGCSTAGSPGQPPVIGKLPPGTDDQRKSESKRFGEPLAPPRIRPPYVRNHCYAATHSGTS